MIAIKKRNAKPKGDAYMSQKYTLCKLEKESVSDTRPLYEKVFWEDQKVFVDYYYTYKARSCIAFVWKDENGTIVSMLHLDPYRLCVKTDRGEEQVKACYVVCVATQESHRHRGLMAGLLQAAEDYCTQQDVPFLFLMPADENIYLPFGYAFIYARKEYYVNYKERPCREDKEKELPACVSVEKIDGSVSEENKSELCKLKQLVHFSNQWLYRHTDFYLYRDMRYYVNLLHELAAQKGGICLFMIDGKLEGYYAQTREENSNMGCGRDGIQEAMLSERLISVFEKENRPLPILESEHTLPVIMGKWIGAKGELLKPRVSLFKRGWINELI